MIDERRGGVLVIDDEPVILEMMRFCLEGHGYRVVAASSVAEGEAFAQVMDPDLVLLDMMLPGEPGMRLAQRLRDEVFAHTPLVAISADRLNLLFAQRSGLFQGTLSKPFEVDDLVALADRYAGRYVTV